MRERQAPRHTYHTYNTYNRLTDIHTHTQTQGVGIKYKDAKTGALLPVVGGPGFHLLDDDDVAVFCMDL